MPTFQSPEEIFRSFVTRKEERQWGHTRQQIDKLYRQMPDGFTSTLRQMLSLRITHGKGYTYDTLESGWTWVQRIFQQSGTRLWEPLRLDDKHLHRFGMVPYRDQLSVEWITVDVLANQGLRPNHARSSAVCGFELFTAVALQPSWAMSIDQNRMPTVCAAEIELSGALTGRVPHIFWKNEKVNLSALRDNVLSKSTSIPTMRSLRMRI